VARVSFTRPRPRPLHGLWGPALAELKAGHVERAGAYLGERLRLAAEDVAAAQERGRARAPQATLRELLVEIES